MYLKFALFLSFWVVVFQLLATITAPLTQKLGLCKYDDNIFGVFGYCNTVSHICSSAHIGYMENSETEYSAEIIYDKRDIRKFTNGNANTIFYRKKKPISRETEHMRLPTLARPSISKILVLHPIALIVSVLLFSMCAGLVVFPKRTCTKKYTFYLFILSWVCFLTTLLAFLADLLLFSSSLSWIGWLSCVSACFLCVMLGFFFLLRREIASQQAYSQLKEHHGNGISDSTEQIEMVPMYNERDEATTFI